MRSSVIVLGLLSACVLIMDASGCHPAKPQCVQTDPVCLNPKAEFYKKYPLLLKLKSNMFKKLNAELEDVVCLDCQTGTCNKCPKPQLHVTPVSPPKQCFKNLIIKDGVKTAPCALPNPAPCAIPSPVVCDVQPAAHATYDMPVGASATYADSSEVLSTEEEYETKEEYEPAEASNLWAQLLQGGFIPQV